jgi:hypothetical protein
VWKRRVQDDDYLLDGLLTASVDALQNSSAQLFVGENFGSPFYVMIVRASKEAEIQSFLQLIKKDLGAESNIIVIDEKSSFETVRPYLKELIPFLKMI